MKKTRSAKTAPKRSGATKKPSPRTSLRAEYDFSGGVRGKHARAFARGTNVIVLAPDVAEEFPTASAVNRALRAYLKAKTGRRTA